MSSTLSYISDEELLKSLQETPSSMESVSDADLLQSLPIEDDSLLTKVGRGALKVARDFTAGTVGGVLDVVTAPVTIPLRAAGYWDHPTYEESIYQGIDKLTNDVAKDKTQAEKNWAAARRGVASLGSGFGLGSKVVTKAPTLGKVLQAGNVPTPTNILAQGATSAVMEHNQDDPLVALGLGAATGYGIHKGSRALKKGAIPAKISDLVKLDPVAIETAKEAGITPLPADVMKSKRAKGAQNLIRNSIPFVGGTVEKHLDKQRGQVLKGLGQMEGLERSTITGGELAKKAADKAKGDFGKKADYLWNKTFSHIGEGESALVKPSHSDSLLDNATKHFKSVGAFKTFDESPIGKWSKRIQEYKIKGGRIDANELRNLRRHIGKEIDWKQPTVEDKQLIDLYDSINTDLAGYFKQKGKGAAKSWENFNKFTSNYLQNHRPIVRKIQKKFDEDAVKAFMETNPSKSQIKKTEYVLKNLDPEDRKEFFNTIVYNKGNTKGDFNPVKAVRELNDMPKPYLDKLLKNSGLDPKAQQKFKYVMSTTDNIRETLLENNTSKTEYTRLLWKSMVGAASGYGLGIPKALAGITLGRYATDKMLTDGKFIDWLYRGMKLKNDKLAPRWIQGIKKIPGIPADTKSKIEKLYMSAIEKDMELTPKAYQKALITAGRESTKKS
jgi:hypothetical protein